MMWGIASPTSWACCRNPNIFSVKRNKGAILTELPLNSGTPENTKLGGNLAKLYHKIRNPMGSNRIAASPCGKKENGISSFFKR